MNDNLSDLTSASNNSQKVNPADSRVRYLVNQYLMGLYWVLQYYHHGCRSWTWYYPDLYGPLGSDFRNIASMKIEFEEGLPFTPLMQLLSVLPPQSVTFLPVCYGMLMVDPNSPLLNAYPSDFEVFE